MGDAALYLDLFEPPGQKTGSFNIPLERHLDAVQGGVVPRSDVVGLDSDLRRLAKLPDPVA
jgi:hypothetical protein